MSTLSPEDLFRIPRGTDMDEVRRQIPFLEAECGIPPSGPLIERMQAMNGKKYVRPARQQAWESDDDYQARLKDWDRAEYERAVAERWPEQADASTA